MEDSVHYATLTASTVGAGTQQEMTREKLSEAWQSMVSPLSAAKAFRPVDLRPCLSAGLPFSYSVGKTLNN